MLHLLRNCVYFAKCLQKHCVVNTELIRITVSAIVPHCRKFLQCRRKFRYFRCSPYSICSYLSRRRAGSSAPSELASGWLPAGCLVACQAQLLCNLVCQIFSAPWCAKPCCNLLCTRFRNLVCQPLCSLVSTFSATWCANPFATWCAPFVQPGVPCLCKPGVATFGARCVHFTRRAVRFDLCDRRSLRSSTVVYLSVHLQTGKFKDLEGAHLEHPILESPPRFGQRTDRETLERPSSGYFF